MKAQMALINWQRVWLAVLVGYIILIIGSNLLFSYLAVTHPELVNWNADVSIAKAYTP